MGADGRAGGAIGAYVMGGAGGMEATAFGPDAADGCRAAGMRSGIRAAARVAQ
jgi:hypothetical protein